MTDDPFMTELMAANALVRDGDRAGGRGRLEALWSRFEADPDPVLECVLAHHMADAQDNPTAELAWDLRALEAALRCGDADVGRHPQMLSIADFMPSLHVSLAVDYFRLGDLVRSREHLASGRGFFGELADDAYGQLIRRTADGLARRLDAPGA